MKSKITTINIISEGSEYCKVNKINLSRFLNQCLVSLMNKDICYQPDFDPIKDKFHDKSVLISGSIPRELRSIIDTVENNHKLLNYDIKEMFNNNKKTLQHIKELKQKYNSDDGVDNE